MGKSLLIVESPTKARTLNRYLGSGFTVKASVGHIKDLPKNRLGIRIEEHFHPEYQVIRGKKKIIEELRQAASKADEILLGSDPDREGEAIAWHIAEELKANGKPLRRVLFYELTRKAIFEALKKPQKLNRFLYEAQQARRILDRLVGYLISPLLWEKVKRGLSAGRVQSAALRLICDREKEIRAFVPREYWTITAHLKPQEEQKEESGLAVVEAQLWRCNNKACNISTEAEALRLVDELGSCIYQVVEVTRKSRRRKPPPPFITSTLQQEASRKLRFSPQRTMRIAQELYEGVELGEEGAVGLITYMRTDSTRLAAEAISAARNFIKERWGQAYLPTRGIVYKAKAGIQDAHEAIRPTDVFRTPQMVAPYLKKDTLALYTLIWKRFIACQMASAVIDQTTVSISAGDKFILRASGSVIRFPGFTTVYEESGDEDKKEGNREGQKPLPDLSEGQLLELVKLIPKQHFTQPPPRFTEASLIRELEEKGIGRPSTYATIVSTISDREYVRLENRRLHPTELGMLISEILSQHFPEVVDVSFTARMERDLDEVEQGRLKWEDLLESFYERFKVTLSKARENMEELRSRGWATDLRCPRCQNPLRIRIGRNGPFIACSNYPECNFTANYERDEKGSIVLLSDVVSTELCDRCGRPMVIKKGRFGEFLACSGYPECQNTKPMTLGIPCLREGCDGELLKRVTRSGRVFYGCSRFPECRETYWNRPVKIPCPRCGAPFLLEKNTKSKILRVCPRKDCDYRIELKE